MQPAVRLDDAPRSARRRSRAPRRRPRGRRASAPAPGCRRCSRCPTPALRPRVRTGRATSRARRAPAAMQAGSVFASLRHGMTMVTSTRWSSTSCGDGFTCVPSVRSTGESAWRGTRPTGGGSRPGQESIGISSWSTSQPRWFTQRMSFVRPGRCSDGSTRSGASGRCTPAG